MLGLDDIIPDQEDAIDRLFNFNATLLVAPTGGGKTVILLTAFDELVADGAVSRLLVIAPLKVCETAWRSESMKWEHLRHLGIEIATGKPKERLAAFASSAEIVVINEENAAWLFTQPKILDTFDAIAIDETSKWGDSGGSRFKKLRFKMRNFKWRVGMTAQPVGENWVSLFAQCLLLDLGASLGRSKDRYLREHFYSTDHDERNWEILPGHDEQIAEKIRGLVHVMPDYKADTLPPKNIRLEWLHMPKEATEDYNRMRIDMRLEIEGDDAIEAQTQAVLSGKLEQMANGFLYFPEEEGVPDREWIELHHVKQGWVENRVRKILSDDESVIVVYWYARDLAWLRQSFPLHDELGQGVNVPEAMEKWQASPGRIMLLHPASAAHGVDGLQDTCHREIWVNPIWGNDKFQQCCDRLWRRPQEYSVEIEVAMCRDTIDEVKWDVCTGKGDYHTLFLEHLGPDSLGATAKPE